MRSINALDIKSIDSEAGVIASILLNPELVFYSEHLKPEHFTDQQNAVLYYAICELAKQGVKKADAYNIMSVINTQYSSSKYQAGFSVDDINNLLEFAPIIARMSPEEYKLIVNNVMNAAFRRETFLKLCECQKICFNPDEKDIEHKIYSALD